MSNRITLWIRIARKRIEVIVPGNRTQKKNRQQQYQVQPRLASRRQDTITRMVVDIGIHYVATLGVRKAAELLREKNIPEAVIARVLHRPQKLRKV